jgi:hypothetical protein
MPHLAKPSCQPTQAPARCQFHGTTLVTPRGRVYADHIGGWFRVTPTHTTYVHDDHGQLQPLSNSADEARRTHLYALDRQAGLIGDSEDAYLLAQDQLREAQQAVRDAERAVAACQQVLLATLPPQQVPQ